MNASRGRRVVPGGRAVTPGPFARVKHIRDHCDAPADVKAILLVMATYTDADRRCYPSLDRLAADLGVHRDTAKRRRNRAVELGWLVIESRGRWKGTSTRYQIQQKGCASTPLSAFQRGASEVANGARGQRSEAGVHAPRTTKKFQEGADSAPSLDSRVPPDRGQQVADRLQLFDGPETTDLGRKAARRGLRTLRVGEDEVPPALLEVFAEAMAQDSPGWAGGPPPLAQPRTRRDEEGSATDPQGVGLGRGFR